MRVEAVARIRQLETAGARLTDQPTAELALRTEELLLLNGRPVALPRRNPNGGAAKNDLAAAHDELKAIDTALAILDEQRQEAIIDNLTEEFAKRRQEWDQLCVDTVFALVDLRRLNRCRDEFLTTFRGASGFVEGPLARIDLSPIFRAGQPGKLFIETALAKGLVTTGETQS